MSDPVTAAAIMGTMGVTSSLIGSGGSDKDTSLEALKYKDPQRRLWAEQMSKQFPEFAELPIGPEAMALVSRMMKGGLAPGVEKAYGIGAEREYGGLAGRLSEIGAGPATTALARAGVMRRLGETVGGARERAVQAGMGFAPQAFQMGMKPYEAARQKWGDIANLFLQTPGAAYAGGGLGGGGGGLMGDLFKGLPFKPGEKMQDRYGDGYGRDIPGEIFGETQPPFRASTPAVTAMQNRMMEQQQPMVGGSQYPLTPMQRAWQQRLKQQQPAAPAPIRQASYGYGYRG